MESKKQTFEIYKNYNNPPYILKVKKVNRKRIFWINIVDVMHQNDIASYINKPYNDIFNEVGVASYINQNHSMYVSGIPLTSHLIFVVVELDHRPIKKGK